tara:strand:+ start:146 stop:715 length:570 start_codon:yes stop_codon:yes gene_type:complete
MPNYCWNILNITGPEEDINKFLDKSKIKEDDYGNGGFSFSGTVPEPDYETTPVKQTYPEISAKYAKTEKEREKIMENKPEIRKDSWWDWRVQNWGTKWQPMDPNIEQGNPRHVQITFDSAWSPPIEWLNKVHIDYPELKFKLEFEEPGMNFYGYVNAYAKNSIFVVFEDDLDNRDFGLDSNEAYIEENV